MSTLERHCWWHSTNEPARSDAQDALSATIQERFVVRVPLVVARAYRALALTATDRGPYHPRTTEEHVSRDG
jgi:hypothetical protein